MPLVNGIQLPGGDLDRLVEYEKQKLQSVDDINTTTEDEFRLELRNPYEDSTDSRYTQTQVVRVGLSLEKKTDLQALQQEVSIFRDQLDKEEQNGIKVPNLPIEQYKYGIGTNIPYWKIFIQKPKTKKMVDLESVESEFVGKVKSIEYKEEKDKMHTCSITIEDTNLIIMKSSRLFRYFWQGQHIVVYMGWQHANRRVIVGRIVKPEPKFQKDGTNLIILKCYDNRIDYKWEHEGVSVEATSSIDLLVNYINILGDPTGRNAMQLQIIKEFKAGKLANFIGLPNREQMNKINAVIVEGQDSRLDDAKFIYNLIGNSSFQKLTRFTSSPSSSLLRLMAVGFAANGVTGDLLNARLQVSGIKNLRKPKSKKPLRRGKDIVDFGITFQDMSQSMPIRKIYQDKKTGEVDNMAWVQQALHNLNDGTDTQLAYIGFAKGKQS